MKRIGVLISGRGTNLQALIDAQAEDNLGGEIVIVISNKSNALGLERATKAGIRTEVVTKLDYPEREDHDRRVVELLRECNVDLVVLAGYMRILTSVLVDAYKNRIINIHPSLLPAFKGVDAQKQALEYGVKITGCTTHFVDLDMDAGPIILQTSVPVMNDDTEETLAERILIEEHKILVRSVRLFCQDRLRLQGRRVLVEE
ncbi:MAG: phosphoribosylglycinamide formyltransferase [Candidatus Thorarchaeota archaeon]|nr:phosphoribosylglycinamide formyltransferase [Candidatus Thorarchaeota archaeon]